MYNKAVLLFVQNWWLEDITDKNEVNDQIKIIFPHLAGPSPLFFFMQESHMHYGYLLKIYFV